ncbi:MAG TPA: HlyD family efflux transporter periplasmic adaptor subunit [Clostridia bacterium]|jgi:hypothetical protein|nr:MAG: HlyD family secretion protein [Firmicutes bacterium ADurb.Bin146]HOD92373.1 HlyD family efflux transporter periplasmic adaptor subunit [Clostridia bacterium]HQM38630.1 HlyD family efflux transporter periplasmic adaptor subunit [Clostridia bacterium]
MKKGNKKVKSEKSTGTVIKIMIIIAFVLFIILVTRMAISYYSKVVKKDIAYKGRLVDQINISGFVLYEFDSYDAITDYSLIQTKKEGSRAGVNNLIGSLANTGNPLYNELKEINAQILSMQQLYQINTGVLSKDIQLIDIQIKNSLLSLSSLLNENKISEALKQKENINSLYEYKTDLMNGDNRRIRQLDALLTRQNELRQAMASDVKDIFCINSGYVTYLMHNEQQNHTYNQMSLLYPEDIKARMSADQAYNDNTVVKVATSKKFHIVTVLTSSDAARIKDLKGLRININTFGLDFIVNINKVIIGNSSNGETVVFFETDNMLSSLVSIGRFDGLLIVKEYTGIKVPTSSIHNYKYATFQQTKIALIKGISVKFVDIDVLYSDGTYAIVEDADDIYSFKAYDYYILEPDKVSDGDVVN